MATTYFEFDISIDDDITEIIRAKQGDANSRFLRPRLLQKNGIPFDLTGNKVRFNAVKKDGQTIFNNAEITDPINGQFTVELTDQTLAVGDSVVVADITILSDDEKAILTTRKFNIHVQSTVRDDDAIESSNEFGAVVTLFQDVWDMRETIKSMSTTMGASTDDIAPMAAPVSFSIFGALNQIWNYLKTQSTAGIVDVVNQILTLIGKANPTANTTTVMGYLRKISDMVTSILSVTGVNTYTKTITFTLGLGAGSTVTLLNKTLSKGICIKSIGMNQITANATYDFTFSGFGQSVLGLSGTTNSMLGYNAYSGAKPTELTWIKDVGGSSSTAPFTVDLNINTKKLTITCTRNTTVTSQNEATVQIVYDAESEVL